MITISCTTIPLYPGIVSVTSFQLSEATIPYTDLKVRYLEKRCDLMYRILLSNCGYLLLSKKHPITFIVDFYFIKAATPGVLVPGPVDLGAVGDVSSSAQYCSASESWGL